MMDNSEEPREPSDAKESMEVVEKELEVVPDTEVEDARQEEKGAAGTTLMDANFDDDDDDDDDDFDEDGDDDSDDDNSDDSSDDDSSDGDDSNDGNDDGAKVDRKEGEGDKEGEDIDATSSKKKRKLDKEKSKKKKRSKNESSRSKGGGDSDEDSNDYEYDDGFVVRDDEKNSDDDNDDDDDDSDDENIFEKIRDADKVKKSKKLNRLKKRTSEDTIDEDELALLQENALEGYDDIGDFKKSSQHYPFKKKPYDAYDDNNVDEDDYIAPIRIGARTSADDIPDEILGGEEFEDDDGSDLGGFLVNEDGDDADDDTDRRQAVVRRPRARTDGPTYDQMKEAEDIFGVGYADDFDDDDLEDGYDENGEPIEIAEGSSDGYRMSLATAEMKIKSKLDRNVLVENFCTDNDDIIRKLDQPERLQSILSSRVKQRDDDRVKEVEWIAHLLAERILLVESSEKSFTSAGKVDTLADELIETVTCFLRFNQDELYEVPFIWTYRRDYLHNSITCAHLRYIMTLIVKWDKTQKMKRKILKTLQVIHEVASSEGDRDDNEYEKEERIRNVKELVVVRNRLRRDSKHTENDLNAAMDHIDAKLKDEEEEPTEEDRQNVENLQQQHDSLIAQQQEAEEKLQIAMDEVYKSRQKQQMKSLYKSDIAVEVTRLFPESRYITLIQSVNDDVVLKDVYAYLQLLLKGAEATDATEDFDIEDMELRDQGVDVKAMDDVNSRSKKKVAASKDTYRKCRSNKAIRDFAELFAISASELGDSIRHHFKHDPPRTPYMSVYDKAQDYVDNRMYKTSNSVIDAVTILLGSEISAEPDVRNAVRTKYRSIATISSRPTEKGITEITPFSEYFGIHYLEKKPLYELLDKSGKDAMLFLRLDEACRNDLITVTIKMPSSSMASFTIDENGPMLMKKFGAVGYVDGEIEKGWQDLRVSIVKASLENYLIPSIELECRREMLRLGRDRIVEEAANNFRKMTSFGPYRPPHESQREATKELLKSCPVNTYPYKIASVYIPPSEIDQCLFLAYIDNNGVVRSHDSLPSKAKVQRRDKIKQFIMDHRPDVIVLNSSGGLQAKTMARAIQEEIIREVRDSIQVRSREARERREEEGNYMDHIDDEDEDFDYKAPVLIVKDKIADIYQRSSRSKKAFPDVQPGVAAAICLARFVRNPLAEYCNLWSCANSTEVFGFEALFLDLHPYQGLIRGVKMSMLHALENVLVDVVCEVGIDLNASVQYDHLSTMLAFVSGMGLRKADTLRQNIRRSKLITCRSDILSRKLLSPTIYNNAAGFLRIATLEATASGIQLVDGGINRTLDPFDNTRIHPECYILHDFAPKICADALEVDLNQNDKLYYSDIVLKLMRSSHRELDRKIKLHPEWVDLWEKGQPIPGVTKYIEKMRRKDGSDEWRETSCELNDGMSMLLLDEYAKELEIDTKTKRRMQLEQIKEELRYPALDLRKPIEPIGDGDFFTSITGETDYTLHVGLKVGCIVLDIIDNYDNRSSQQKQYATCRTDSGLLGRIDAYDVIDDRIDPDSFNISQYLQPGMRLFGIIIGVQKRVMKLDLSIKPSLLQESEVFWMQNRRKIDVIGKKAARWFDDAGRNIDAMFDRFFLETEALNKHRDAIDDINKANQLMTKVVAKRDVIKRQVFHPLFANISNYREAEERLRSSSKGAGAVIIRPSGSAAGSDSLTLTWAFQDNWFKHIPITEKNKVASNLGLGDTLCIKGEVDPFSDLDEIYSRYVEPMNDLVSGIMRISLFNGGNSSEVERHLREQKEAKGPGRIAYCIGFDHNVPGNFLFLYYGNDHKVRKISIKLRSDGYLLESKDKSQQVFSRTDKLLMHLKSTLNDEMLAAEKKKNQPPPPRQPPAPPAPPAPSAPMHRQPSAPLPPQPAYPQYNNSYNSNSYLSQPPPPPLHQYPPSSYNRR